MTNVLLAFRDVIAVAFVYLALRSGACKPPKIIIEILLVWTVIVVFWSLVVNLVFQSPIWIVGIGLRFWLLYLWFAVVAGYTLTQRDVRFCMQTIFWIGFATLPLAVYQHFMPPGHFINTLPDTATEEIFTVAGDIVRTSGTFSFGLGYGCFIALFAAITITPTVRGEKLITQIPFLSVVAPILALVLVAVSGSRGAIGFFVFVFIAAFVLELVPISGTKSGGAFAKIAALLIGGVLLLAFFDRAINATQERIYVADQSEDLLLRLISVFVGEEGTLERFTPLGSGIGSGTQAAAIISGAGKVFLLAETEPGRVLLEGGLLGILWILIKIVSSTTGILLALRLWTRTGEVLPVLIWITIATAIVTWPISGQISAHALAFISLALGLALLRPANTTEYVTTRFSQTLPNVRCNDAL